MTKNVYVSYAWEKSCEEILTQLQIIVKKTRINLLYDKKSLKYKGSIKEFTHLIGQAKYVILIISNNYFKSEYCMYELINISKSKNFKKRIFPIVLSNVKVYNTRNRIDIIKYWQNITAELDQKAHSISHIKTQKINESITLYAEIRDNIDSLADVIIDINNYSYFMHKNNDYTPVIEAIETCQNSFEEDETLFKESPQKLFSEFAHQTHLINSLLKWINENKLVLINEIVNKLIHNMDKYNSYLIIESKNREILIKSISEHFDWIVAVLDFQDKTIPLKKFVEISPIICESYAIYKDIFTELLERLENKNNSNNPPKESIPYLVDLIKILINKY